MNSPAHLVANAGLPAGRTRIATPGGLRADVAALAKAMDEADYPSGRWCYCGPAGVHMIEDYENWPEEAKEWARNMAAYAAYALKDEA